MNLDENILFGNVYLLPENRKFYNDEEFLTMKNEIMSFCSKNKYVLLSGDSMHVKQKCETTLNRMIFWQICLRSVDAHNCAVLDNACGNTVYDKILLSGYLKSLDKEDNTKVYHNNGVKNLEVELS